MAVEFISRSNLHLSMGPGRDRTLSPCICSQTCICNPTRYRLRCGIPLKVLSHEMNVSSGVSKVNSIYVYIRPKHFLFSVTLTTLIFWGAYSNRTVRPSVCPSVPLRLRSYLLYSLRYEFQFWYVDTSWDGGVSRTLFVSL